MGRVRWVRTLAFFVLTLLYGCRPAEPSGGVGQKRARAALAGTVAVGAGGYTTVLPAGAAAPQSTIYREATGPVPTHRFWTSKYWNPVGTTSNGGPVYMVPQPLSMQSTPSGMKLGFYDGVIDGGTYFSQPFQDDLTLGTAGLNASAVNVSAESDWSADFDFGPITVRAGRGFPFVYALTNGANPQITFSGTPTVFFDGGNVLGVSIANNAYGLFCPTNGTWSGVGTRTLTCNLPPGHDYFSLALLPGQTALSAYAKVAFSFPTDTRVSWRYDPATSQVTTTYTVTTRAMEGTETGFLQALYPHQYGSLQGAINTSHTYRSPRGTMKVQSGSSFSTVDTYRGVLPFLPPTGKYSTATLGSYLLSVVNEGNHFTYDETYGLGKQLNRIAQLLPLADVAGDAASRASLQASLESKLESWFAAPSGRATDLFYYDENWGALIGYPASYGSDTSLNDHHFHYGYWLHAAALLGLYDPAWLAQARWGGMVDLLRQDIANHDRANSLFPFLRNFDVYAGHSWASGQAPFGDGENQESTSEAVNAWAGLILYGVQTGNTQIRDTGIWLYTLETNAAFDYWFNDGPVPTFPSGFTRTSISNVFDSKGDTGTWFSAVPELSHGIQFLPFTGGSLYLGRDPAYVARNYAEIVSLSGGSFNPASDNWPDIIEEYEAFADPAKALAQWGSTTYVFDGETKAHEYYWLNELAELGTTSTSVTANTPLYAVFKNPTSGKVTHVAFNAATTAQLVTFSDGATLTVPAGSLASEYGVVNVNQGTSGGAPPAAPSGLHATAVSASQIDLGWSASASAGVTYSVYRSTTSGFSSASANRIAAGLTSPSYSDTGLSAGTTYYFLVTATNADGESPASAQVSATTSATFSLATSTVGSGTVTRDPDSLSYAAGTSVTLTATPTSGYAFTGWSGDASGETNPLTLQVNANLSVVAHFAPSGGNTFALVVTRAGAGSGTVASSPAGVSCGATCSADYASGTSVTLTAAPDGGSTFAGWGGACSGTATTCTVSMTRAQDVTATFSPASTTTFTLTITRAGAGSGRVTSSPSGVSCDGTCSVDYPSGASLTLTAVPDAGSTFAGWSGACSGTTTACTVSLTEARSVVAHFDRPAASSGGCSSGGTGAGLWLMLPSLIALRRRRR